MKALVAIMFILSSNVSIADTLTIKSGSVEWQAIGNPGLIKIDGEGGKPTGIITSANGKVSGTFECAMADFDTGIAMRTEHMRDKYLEVKKFPKAVLKLDPTAATGDVNWTGQLTIKGVTKPVKGTATITAASVNATFVVNLEDYPIGIPSFLGVTTAKDVTVKVKAEASK